MLKGTGAVGRPLDLSGRNSRLAWPLFHPPVAFRGHFSQRATTLLQHLAQTGPHRGLCEIAIFIFSFISMPLFSRRSTARSTPTAVVPALCPSIPYKLRAFHEKLLPNGPLKTPDKSGPNDTRLTFFFHRRMHSYSVKFDFRMRWMIDVWVFLLPYSLIVRKVAAS